MEYTCGCTRDPSLHSVPFWMTKTGKKNKNSVELRVLRGAKKKSFVVVMTIGGEDKHNDLIVIDTIDHPVLLGDFATPAPLGFSLQGFGVSGSHKWMFFQFFDKTQGFLISFRFALGQFRQSLEGQVSKADFILHSHIALACR